MYIDSVSDFFKTLPKTNHCSKNFYTWDYVISKLFPIKLKNVDKHQIYYPGKQVQCFEIACFINLPLPAYHTIYNAIAHTYKCIQIYFGSCNKSVFEMKIMHKWNWTDLNSAW